MKLYVVRPSAWANAAELGRAGSRSASVGNKLMVDRLRWIRSYVVEEVDGRLGTVCIYQADGSASIRDHAARVGIPGDQVLPVVNSLILRPDPRS